METIGIRVEKYGWKQMAGGDDDSGTKLSNKSQCLRSLVNPRVTIRDCKKKKEKKNRKREHDLSSSYEMRLIS